MDSARKKVYKRNMKGIFEAYSEKMVLLKGLVVFAVFALGVVGHLKGAEGSIPDKTKVEKEEERILTDNQAKEVIKIWRVIGDQEIVTWDGKEWLAKTKAEKREAIGKACEAWREAGYKNIESVDDIIKDVDKYYRHFEQKRSEELEEKIGTTISLQVFFGGMEKGCIK
jgi:hypothetical protein